jgi:MFS transporter, NNP family, nitrate/nitrite transporter
MKPLDKWLPEDAVFWQAHGAKLARRNLWISVPCLLCAFAIWLYWSIIIVQMQNLGFPYTTTQLYMLPAIAGLTGATLRIPNSFLIALCGGRNVIAVTTALLILPALGAGIALRSMDTPFWVFGVLAALSGIGGGNFASSMSNISLFFPKHKQGLALGINAGLGNIGVSIMQVLLPLAMTVGLFGILGGAPFETNGARVWLQNSGLVWVPILLFLSLAAWFGMHNMPVHKTTRTPVAVGQLLWLELLGFTAAGAGLFLLLWLKLSMWLVLPITVILTLGLMRYGTPRPVRENLRGQFVIFRDKHTWIMTYLYTMTFGSFIGYSAAFPKLIQDVFGTLPDGTVNLAAPNPFAYAWLGPLVGSLVRPLGGWISDKFGGARVTQWTTVVMIGAALGAAYFVSAARSAASPETYFLPFLLLFLLLFTTAGIGNGSTFRMIPIIFKPTLAGPVLGWTSAVGAYGSFIIPVVFGGQIQRGTPQYALYGFAVYYVSCLALNWWYYARKRAEIAC